MSFLQGLGSFAGGLDQTLGPLLQQYQQNVATGQGIAAMYGGQSQQPSSLQGLAGGGAPNVPVPSPSMGQGASMSQPSTVPVSVPQAAQTQLSSIPQLSQAPTTPVPSQAQPSPLPASAPRTAQGGQTSPGRMPQQASAPPQAQPQPQPQKPPTDLSPFNNQFDFNTLMQAVVRHNMANGRPNYEQIGRIANSPAFERMLSQQGLQQYRALNLGIREQGIQLGEERLAQQGKQFADKEKDIADRQLVGEGFRTGLATSGANIQNLSRQREEINKQVVAGIITPEAAAPQLKQISDAIGGEIAKMNSLKPGGGGASSGGDSVPSGTGTEQDPVIVKTPKDAQGLAPGTIYKTPDGQMMVR